MPRAERSIQICVSAERRYASPVNYEQIEKLVAEAHIKRGVAERSLQEEARIWVERLFESLAWPETRRRFDIAAAPGGAAIESDVKAQILPSGAVVYWFSLFAGTAVVPCELQIFRSHQALLVTFSVRGSSADSIAENLLLDAEGTLAAKHFDEISKVIATAAVNARA